MMIATIFFLIISITIIFGLAIPVSKQKHIVANLIESRRGYFLSEAGIEDVVYRLKTGKPVSSTEVLSLNGSSATTVSSDISGGKEVVSTANVNNSLREIKIKLLAGEGVAFHYGVQVGAGGFVLSNGAGVNGNIYSNGNISGSNGAFITGSAISVGTINRVIVGTGTTGDAHAPTVTNSTVRGNLYCQTGSVNNKTCNSSQPNPIPQNFPIADTQITNWKSDATLGGTFIGTKTIDGTSNTLGPLKIQGNLLLSNGAELELTGTIWVTGTITVSNNSTVSLAPSYGSSSGLIIVDGTTTLSNGSVFEGSGIEGSSIMLLSTNSGSGAVTLSNNAGAVIIYAQNGTVNLSNNSNVQQITAGTISLSNNAIIDYEQGLRDTSFSSGPSGGWNIESWKEK